jgi:hypothetical protein
MASLSDYQRGGKVWNYYAAKYGAAGADSIAAAYASGGTAAVSDELTRLKGFKPVGSASATVNLWDQLTTDPLAAPLESANNAIGNTVLSFLKNPWVLATIGVLVWGWLGFPGMKALRKKLA